MRSILVMCIAASILTGLVACSSHRVYTGEHDRFVDAVTNAVADESGITSKAVKRTDTTGDAGEKITHLRATYARHSTLHARIVSPDGGKQPKLEVNIKTRDMVHTRHKDWEQRVLDRVALELKDRDYSDYPRPTSRPPAKIPEPKAITKDAGK